MVQILGVDYRLIGGKISVSSHNCVAYFKIAVLCVLLVHHDLNNKSSFLFFGELLERFTDQSNYKESQKMV